jgi:nitronate monooxygenase
MLEPDDSSSIVERSNRALRHEIRKAREMSNGNGLLGVNIMVALSNFEELARTAIDERIDIIFAGAGLPLNLPKLAIKNMPTKFIPIVSSGRAAAIIAKRWIEKYNYVPDGFVLEGPLAGGHLGFKIEEIEDSNFTLDKLLLPTLKIAREIEERFKRHVPVIAAGGIYTGADIHHFLELGASGVQMATRFVTTHECDAAIEFKQAYVNSRPEDILIIKSPVGLPGRVLRNKFVEEIVEGRQRPFECPYHCIVTCDVKKSPYCIALALVNAKLGDLSNGFAFCGSNAHRAKEIISVKDLINILKDEFCIVALKGRVENSKGCHGLRVDSRFQVS